MKADAVIGFDGHCCNSVTLPFDGIFGGGTILEFVENWLAGLITPVGYNVDGHFVSGSIPAITDCENYSGDASDSYDRFDPDTGTTFTSAYTLSVSWSKTETGYIFSLSYTSTQSGAGGTWMGHNYNSDWEFSGSLTLSDVNLGSDVYADAVDLSSNWDMTNNAIIPWQIHSYTMFMPKVIRREVGMNVNPIGFNTYTMDDFTSPVYVSGSIDHYSQIPWRDPNDYFWIWAPGSGSILATGIGSTHYDGTVIGKPFIVPNTSSVVTGAPVNSGSGNMQVWGWFDFYYTDLRFCKTPVDEPSCGTSPPWELYTYRYGGTLADCDISVSGIEDGAQFINILPKCSTHWVNNVQAHSIPKGGSVSCGVINEGITVIKYAECRPKYPSHNFFRPCGDDRAAIDEDTAQCFVDDLVMQNALPSTNLILLTFTSGHDGIYTGSIQTAVGDGTYTLTLGTKLRDLPSNYYHPFQTQFEDETIYGDFGLVGVIRFPNAWPICGREAVTVTSGSIGSGSIITFANSEPNLASNDKLTLYDVSMNTLVTASVFRNSDNEFTSSLSFSGSITASRWAQSYGSPDYHWNDSGSKLQYRDGEWDWSNRDGSNISSSLDDCIKASPCAESVVCFSPNGESFPNGVTSWFSGSTTFDVIYGSMRQLNVEFGITDPFYQTPKTPCSVLGLVSPKFVQDTGGCPDDTTDALGNPIIYYPPPPLIEAMVSTPTGAPALPSFITWPVMSQPALPGVVGFSFSAKTQPWEFMANERATCDAMPSCRFIRFYSAC